MHITVRKAAQADLPAVLAMSDAFVAENCCNGMVPDTLDYLEKQTIYLAEADGQPVGYAYGHVPDDHPLRASFAAHWHFYEIDEVYIAPAWRSQGAGERLFLALRREAMAQGCTALYLNAVNRDWQRLLHFYCDRMGMSFFSASLYMDLDDEGGEPFGREEID